MEIKEIVGVVVGVIASFGGGGVIVAAFSGWLGKVWAIRLMDQERARHAEQLEKLRSNLEQQHRLLQGEVEKTIFVTKVHFETEFRALTEIWRHIARVRAAMSDLRPMLEWANPNETKEAALNRRLEVFGDALGVLVDAVDQQSPFYPEDIYQALDRLIHKAKLEGNDASLPFERFEPPWYQRGKTNFVEFCTLAEEVSGLIRERISKLSVYGTAFVAT